MRLTIETPRLILRPPEHADAEALACGLADFDVARMTARVPHPYTVEVGEGWIVVSRMQRRRGFAYNFVMEAREDGGVVGDVGVFRRTPGAEWEVGYWVAKKAWGKGYASEALAAIIAWARAELGTSRLIAAHFDDNLASRRVLEKAGFRPTGASASKFSLARCEKAMSIDMALELPKIAVDVARA
jgi:RimJ/RimL family protein N-acetyltransferase